MSNPTKKRKLEVIQESAERAASQTEDPSVVTWNPSVPSLKAMYSITGHEDAEMFTTIEDAKKSLRNKRMLDDPKYNKLLPHDLSLEHRSRTPTPTFSMFDSELQKKKDEGAWGGRKRTQRRNRSARKKNTRRKLRRKAKRRTRARRKRSAKKR